MGDFNNNLFDPSKSLRLRSFCGRNNLFCCHNSLPTHYDITHNSTSLLDYFLCSNVDLIEVKDQFQCPAISRHAFVFCSVKICVKRTDKKHYFYDFSNIDLNLCVDMINGSNFEEILSCNLVNDQVEIFDENLHNLLSFVPIKQSFTKAGINIFQSREVIYAKSLRDIAFKAFLENKTVENWKNYCKLRNRAKNVIRKVIRKQSLKMFAGVNSKQMWNVLRDNGVVDTPDRDNSLDVSGLNNYFLSHQNLNPSSEEQIRDIPRPDEFSFHTVSVDEIVGAMNQIQSNTTKIVKNFISIYCSYNFAHGKQCFDVIYFS